MHGKQVIQDALGMARRAGEKPEPESTGDSVDPIGRNSLHMQYGLIITWRGAGSSVRSQSILYSMIDEPIKFDQDEKGDCLLVIEYQAASGRYRCTISGRKFHAEARHVMWGKRAELYVQDRIDGVTIEKIEEEA